MPTRRRPGRRSSARSIASRARRPASRSGNGCRPSCSRQGGDRSGRATGRRVRIVVRPDRGRRGAGSRRANEAVQHGLGARRGDRHQDHRQHRRRRQSERADVEMPGGAETGDVDQEHFVNIDDSGSLARPGRQLSVAVVRSLCGGTQTGYRRRTSPGGPLCSTNVSPWTVRPAPPSQSGSRGPRRSTRHPPRSARPRRACGTLRALRRRHGEARSRRLRARSSRARLDLGPRCAVPAVSQIERRGEGDRGQPRGPRPCAVGASGPADRRLRPFARGTIALCLAERYGAELAGLAVWNANLTFGLQERLAVQGLKVERAMKGSDVASRLFARATFEAWGRSIPGARTMQDWLSHDPAVVDAYARDPLCGFTPTVSMASDIVDLVRQGVDAAQLSRLPADLPIHLLGGGSDPGDGPGRGDRSAGGPPADQRLAPDRRRDRGRRPARDPERDRALPRAGPRLAVGLDRRHPADHAIHPA